MSDPIGTLKGLFSPADVSIPTQSHDAMNKGETYNHYGVRMSGASQYSNDALVVFLQRIYHDERNKQINDRELQEKKRNEVNSQIEIVSTKIVDANTQKTICENNVQTLNDKINDVDSQIKEIKAREGSINKEAKVKLWIGCVILALLTVYLFIFYSSTFYSGFLYDVQSALSSGGLMSLSTAMFNASALAEAYAHGFGSFVFVVTAPVIFMALGYSLHYFMVQDHWTKWVKCASLLIITLSFDCLLAYKIAEQMYNINALNSIADYPPFNLNLAILDVNTWVVIFCGFIVYVIWGIVFDMTMSAYNGLRSNKAEIVKLQSQIDNWKNAIAVDTNKIASLDASLQNLLAKKHSLEQKAANKVFVNEHLIETSLNQFFAGWMSMLAAYTTVNEELQKARDAYSNTVNQLIEK